MRVGHGFDVHAFKEGRKLILGGVEVVWDKGLAGHSDADVLVHAICDALLGAVAAGDIGMHFPDNDNRYKDISSLYLLGRVLEMIKSKGFSVINIDATIVAEKPKLKDFIPLMKKKIAETLAISETQVNVKATTTEGLGFTGREEGIAVYSVVSLRGESIIGEKLIESLPEDIVEKIRCVRLLLLDVDGVMTDGGIIYDDRGRDSKVFDVKDGHGIKLLIRGGVNVGIITSRESEVVSHRARDLGIGLVYQGVKNKIDALEDILKRKDLHPEDIAYIGDDLVDIPVLKRIGFSVAVSDSIAELQGYADYKTGNKGGKGAVREVCELILKVQGMWGEVTKRYFL
ncbi:MAG: 2-C-methyl-D-erythritol 2,4-cyclodiphosphate synthase [Thermodesulfobacteriota bacterium]